MSSSHPTLGNVIEICIATFDLEQTVRELAVFGIGPWKVYTFDTKDNISNGMINGQLAEFRLRVAFAQLTKDIAYEIIQPVKRHNDASGDIFSSWLEARNGLSGIHHIAYDCDNIPWEDRMHKFEQVGAQFVQGGTWHGKKGTCQFAWFKKAPTGDDAGHVGTTSTFFETILFSEDWEDPEPDTMY